MVALITADRWWLALDRLTDRWAPVGYPIACTGDTDVLPNLASWNIATKNIHSKEGVGRHFLEEQTQIKMVRLESD